MKFKSLVLVTLILALFSCKTASNRGKELTQGDGNLSDGNKKDNKTDEKYIIPPPPQPGGILKVRDIDIFRTQFRSASAIQIKVNKDLRADYVQIWVCERGEIDNCQPSSQKPKQSASGIFYLYEIPDDIITVYAQACMTKKNAINSTDLCGPEKEEDYISTKFPLNDAATMKILSQIEDGEDDILENCRNFYENELESYNNSTDKTDPDLEIIATNEEKNSTEHLCAQLMNVIDLSKVDRSGNLLIALLLGTASGVSLIGGVVGTYRAYKVNEYLSEIKSNKNEIKIEIETLQKDISSIQDNINKQKLLKNELDEDYQKLQEIIESLEEKIQNTAKSQVNTIESSKTLNSQVSIEQNNLSELRKKIKNLQSDIAHYDKELENLNKNLLSLNETQRNFDSKIQKYNEGIENLNRQNRELDLKISNRRSQIPSQIASKEEELRNKLKSELKIEVENSLKELFDIMQAENELDRLKLNMSTNIQQIQKLENDTSKNSKDRLLKKLQKLEKDLEDFESKNKTELNSYKIQISNEIALLENSRESRLFDDIINDQQSKLKDTKKEIEKITDSILELNRKVETIENEISETSNSVSNSQKSIEPRTQLINEYIEKIELLTQEIEKLTIKLDSERQALIDTEKKAQLIRAKIDDVQQKLNEFILEKSKLDANVNERTQTLKNLKEDLKPHIQDEKAKLKRSKGLGFTNFAFAAILAASALAVGVFVPDISLGLADANSPEARLQSAADKLIDSVRKSKERIDQAWSKIP